MFWRNISIRGPLRVLSCRKISEDRVGRGGQSRGLPMMIGVKGTCQVVSFSGHPFNRCPG